MPDTSNESCEHCAYLRLVNLRDGMLPKKYGWICTATQDFDELKKSDQLVVVIKALKPEELHYTHSCEYFKNDNGRVLETCASCKHCYGMIPAYKPGAVATNILFCCDEGKRLEVIGRGFNSDMHHPACRAYEEKEKW